MARYGELFLKSEPVMHHFIGMLLRNIRHALTAHGLSARYETPRGRILIFGDEPARIAEIVARVFGVIDVSTCTITAKDVGALSGAAADLASARLHPGMSFAVRAKRQQKIGLTSQELGEQIGSAVYDRVPGLRVDLNRPDYEVFVEVRDFGGLVYDSRIPAPGASAGYAGTGTCPPLIRDRLPGRVLACHETRVCCHPSSSRCRPVGRGGCA